MNDRRRTSWLLTVVALLVCATPALAQAPLPFDPDVATREWMATMGAAATARSDAYFTGGYWIPLVSAAILIAASYALLALGWAAGVRTWLERRVKLRFLVAFGTAVFFLVATSIVSFPFDYWVGYVREHAYGLSTQTVSAWAGEYAIAFTISVVLSALLVALLYAVVRWTGRAWWIWGAGVTALLMALVVFAAPVYIAPLFNTYTPMAPGPERDAILTMAQENGVPADNVYVFDASRQSHRVTANVSGMFGTTRVSLADNLLDRASPAAVRAVVGHEIGHYVLGHTYSLLAMITPVIAITFILLDWGFRRLSRNGRWGIRGLDDPAGLPLAVALIAVLGVVGTPISNNITRFHEHQADIFGINASRAPDGFAEAAVLLSEYRKMEPGPIEEWFFYDHPSGWDRIHMAMVWKAHEMAAGRLPMGPGGPPAGWHPDFVVMGK